MGRFLKTFEMVEKSVVVALSVMLMVAVLCGVVEMAFVLGRQIAQPPLLRVDVNRLQELFGSFLMILIGIELLHSVKMYITHEQTQLQVVFTVAMIAIARKVIILDLTVVPSLSLVGLGAVILSLVAGYYLIRRAGVSDHPPLGGGAGAVKTP